LDGNHLVLLSLSTHLIIGWKSPGSPFPEVSFKSTWRREACSLCLQSPPVPHYAPFCMSLLKLLINSIYTYVSYNGFFPIGHKEFGSLLITDSTPSATI
jgi:hypothetical protein